MRSFYIRDADGPQDNYSAAKAVIHRPAEAAGVLADFEEGEYTVRDALGGLRLRIRKDASGETRVIERTR